MIIQQIFTEYLPYAKHYYRACKERKVVKQETDNKDKKKWNTCVNKWCVLRINYNKTGKDPMMQGLCFEILEWPGKS